MADKDKNPHRYHYTYINNVVAHFFKNTLDYFGEYLYPPIKTKTIATYDKAVQYILDVNSLGRELDKPNLPAMILNPSGDFGLADAITGAHQQYHFPNLHPGFIKRFYEPIYLDDNVRVTVGFTRLKGELEFLCLLRSFYEYTDLRLFLIQIFGGLDRYIYPIYFNSYIIFPPDVYLYEYNNPVTGVKYQLDWESQGTKLELIKSIAKKEIIFPCVIKPLYKLTSLADNSMRYGGVDKLADWRLTFNLEYEIEIPSFIMIESDLCSGAGTVAMEIGYSTAYSAYSKNGVNINDEKQILEANEDGTATSTRASLKIRYFHAITQADVDADLEVHITIPEKIDDQRLFTLSGKDGPLTYGSHYVIDDTGTDLTILKKNVELEVNEILELYVYQYDENKIVQHFTCD